MALPRAIMALTAVVAACSRSPARSVPASPTVMVSSPALTLSPSAGADASGGDAAVAGARTLIPHEGVPRAWWGDSWEDASWDLAYTVRPRWFPRHVLLLGIGGGSAGAEFTRDRTGVPKPDVIVIEPDPAIRAQAAALGLAEGAKVAAGEEAIPAGATFDVILVDLQDDRSPYLASLDAAKAGHVRRLLNDDGLLLLRRIARPSDPQLAVAARLFAVGFPFQRLVGSRLDGAEQDLLLVLSRKPIDGAFVYNGAPRVELPPPAGGGPERDLAAVRQAAEHGGEAETRVGYVRYHGDQLGIEGPCPEDASPGAGLTGPGARELAPRSSAEGTHYATRLPDDQDTVVALLGLSGSDDCTTRLSHLAAAVQGTRLSETNLLSVSAVLFAVDSAQWKSLRRAVVAPRMTAAAAAILHGDGAGAEKSLFAAMSDLEAHLGPAVRSTRAFDAILAMREILLAHSGAGPSPRGCAAMLAQADDYFARTMPPLRGSLEDPEGLRSGEPLDALKIRAAFGRCAGLLR